MRLVANNFRCYRNIDITFERGANNVVLGDSDSTDYADTNGSGKTSIMYALCYALFGTWPGMPDADAGINVAVGSDMLVWLEFTTRSGQKAVVQRGRRPNKLGLWIDGHEITGDNRVLKARVEDAFGCNFDFFCKAFIFTGESEHTFASLTDGAQKKMLDILVPVELEDPLARATADARAAKDVVSQLSAKLSVHETSSQNLADRITLEKQKIAAATLAIPEGFDDALTWSYIRQVDEHIAALQAERTNLSALLSDVTMKRQQLEQLEQSIISAHRWLNQHNNEVLSANAKIAALMDTVPTENAEANCPTCGQPLQRGTSLVEVTNKIQLEVAQWHTAAQEAHEKAQEYVATIAELNREVSAAQGALNAAVGLHDTHLKRVIETDEELAKLGETRAAYQEQIQTYNHHRAVLDGGVLKTLEDQAYQAKAQSAQIEVEIDSNRKLQARLKRVIEALGPKGIKHFAIERICPELSALASTFLNTLSDNSLLVSFATTKKKRNKEDVVEKLHIEASKRGLNGEIVQGYANFSRGEKARIDIVVFLALFVFTQRHVNNTGVLLLDEIADALDVSGKTRVVELLEDIAQEYNVCVLTLTNDERITSAVPRGYRCKMQAGGATITPIMES